YLTGIYEPFDTLIPAPADQRFLMSSGPFDIDPDSMVTIAFAVFFADWYGTYVTPDTALVAINEIVQDYYDMHWYLYTGVEENSESRSANYRINVKPNPVVRNGNIQFSLSRDEHVTLKLYNALGQLAQTLFDGFKSAGVHDARLETEGLQQGIHFLVLETADNKERISLIVVR
ncbi:MAG: T9SS type A sorting domain-containing protein, partial [candidate division WOR-3 bacterium]